MPDFLEKLYHHKKSFVKLLHQQLKEGLKNGIEFLRRQKQLHKIQIQSTL
jgi:hypothetical protein